MTATNPRLNPGVFTSESSQWATPTWLLSEIHIFLGPRLYDPCPLQGDGAAMVNGLAVSWAGHRVFCNPPYGRAIGAWVAKALAEPVDEAVLLLPARTDAAWFAPLFERTMLCFLRGRLRFGGCTSNAPFPSVLAYRGVRCNEFARHFGHCGGVVSRVGLPLRATLWGEG